WVYVPVERRPLIGGMRLRVGPEGQKLKRFDSLSLASPATVKRWGITQPVTLVEAEVNGGVGGPADECFVATGFRVVEGTRDYPLRTSTVLAALRKQHQDFVRDQQAALERFFREANQALAKDVKATGKAEKTELLYATWLPETRRLRAVFRT